MERKRKQIWEKGEVHWAVAHTHVPEDVECVCVVVCSGRRAELETKGQKWEKKETKKDIGVCI